MDRNYPPDIFGDESLKEIRNNEATTPMESSPIKRTRQGQQGAESVPRGHEGHAMGEETLQRNGADQNGQNERKRKIPSFFHPTAASQRKTAGTVARTPTTIQRPAWNGGSTRGTIRTPTTPSFASARSPTRLGASTRSPTRRSAYRAARPAFDPEIVFNATTSQDEVGTVSGIGPGIATDVTSHIGSGVSPGIRTLVDGPNSGIAPASRGHVQADMQSQAAGKLATQPPASLNGIFQAPSAQDAIRTGYGIASGSRSIRASIERPAIGRQPVESNAFFNTPSVQKTFRALMNGPAVGVGLAPATAVANGRTTATSRRTTVAPDGPVDPLIRIANGNDIFGSGIKTASASRYPVWFDDEPTIIYDGGIDLNPTPAPGPASTQPPSSNYADAGTQQGAGAYVSVGTQPTGSSYIDVGTQTVGIGLTLAERHAVEMVELEAQMRRQLMGIIIGQMEAQNRGLWGQASTAVLARPPRERVEAVETDAERGSEVVAEAEAAVREVTVAAVVAAREVAVEAVTARPSIPRPATPPRPSTPEAQRDADDFTPPTPWAPSDRVGSSSPLPRTYPPNHLGPVITYPSSPAVAGTPTSAAPVLAEGPVPATVTESTLFGTTPAATFGESTALLGSPPTAILDEVFAEIMEEVLGLAPAVTPATGSRRGSVRRDLAPVTGFVRRTPRSSAPRSPQARSTRHVHFASIDEIVVYEDETAGEVGMSDDDSVYDDERFWGVGRRLGGGGYDDDNKENIAP